MATSVKKKKTESKSRPGKPAATKPAAAKREKNTSDKRPYWEVLAEIGAQVPPQEWAKLHDDDSIKIEKSHRKSRPRKPEALKEENSKPSRPFWEIIVELGESIPLEERKKVPRDSSINYKHYLYGAPKQK